MGSTQFQNAVKSICFRDQKTQTHLKDIDFPVKDSDVTLLIGTDHADLLLHKDIRQGQYGEPTAVKTTLGWVLMGGS